jgi:hypothetical protein
MRPMKLLIGLSGPAANTSHGTKDGERRKQMSRRGITSLPIVELICQAGTLQITFKLESPLQSRATLILAEARPIWKLTSLRAAVCLITCFRWRVEICDPAAKAGKFNAVQKPWSRKKVSMAALADHSISTCFIRDTLRSHPT